MYRPQKKKKEVQQQPIESLDSATPTTSSDLRATLLKDKIISFFISYKNYLIFLSCCAILSLGIIPLYKWTEARKDRITQLAYQKSRAGTLEEKQAFAYNAFKKRNRLGGIVRIELGDHYFLEKNYKSAAGYYASAIAQLRHMILASRIIESQAVALGNNKDIKQAKELLESLINDPKLLNTFRAEALHQKMVLDLSESNKQEAQHSLDILLERYPTSFWCYRAKQLLETVQ